MARQGNLFDQFGETVAEQRSLFGGEDYSTSRRCSECNGTMVRTDSGYDVCRAGCGKLHTTTQENDR